MLNNLGLNLTMLGRFDEAIERLEECSRNSAALQGGAANSATRSRTWRSCCCTATDSTTRNVPPPIR